MESEPFLAHGCQIDDLDLSIEPVSMGLIVAVNLYRTVITLSPFLQLVRQRCRRWPAPSPETGGSPQTRSQFYLGEPLTTARISAKGRQSIGQTTDLPRSRFRGASLGVGRSAVRRKHQCPFPDYRRQESINHSEYQRPVRRDEELYGGYPDQWWGRNMTVAAHHTTRPCSQRPAESQWRLHGPPAIARAKGFEFSPVSAMVAGGKMHSFNSPADNALASGVCCNKPTSQSGEIGLTASRGVRWTACAISTRFSSHRVRSAE
jgi:hypothetical protein